MSAKEELLDTAQLVLKRLPDNATLRDFIDELEVTEEVEAGLRDVEAGRVMSFEEFKRRTAICVSK
jgi:predicted transcriptional regulator